MYVRVDLLESQYVGETLIVLVVYSTDNLVLFLVQSLLSRCVVENVILAELSSLTLFKRDL